MSLVSLSWMCFIVFFTNSAQNLLQIYLKYTSMVTVTSCMCTTFKLSMQSNYVVALHEFFLLSPTFQTGYNRQ